MIAISNKKKSSVWLKTKDGTTIKSSEEMKLLGFIFSESPDCNSQVSSLIKKATRRKYILCHYSKFMPGSDLKKLYCSLVRSVLEYSAVTYGPQISKYQSNRIENVQKQCLKIMYGYNKCYNDLLIESGLETLHDRRQKLLQSFAVKLSKNKNYDSLLPLNESRLSARNPKVYKELYTKTDRLYSSPLYTIRRILNNTPKSDRFNNPRLIDLSSIFNDPY